MWRRGTIYHSGVDVDVLDAIEKAAERVYGVKFRRRFRPIRWFVRRLRDL